ncbi:MAG: glycosyltransferase family 1 protein [Acidimicrobiales bacterium]
MPSPPSWRNSDIVNVRIAVDATSLIGHRTGIGGVTRTYLHRLARPNFEISAFAVSRRGAGPMLDELPSGVEAHRRPMVARPLRSLWRRGPWPPIEWWTGAIDLVWGPNYVVPPAKNAARVVMVHDLTAVHFPEMCTRDVQQMPSLLRREILDGAWINTPSQAVADDVIETLQVDPHRVRAIHLGGPEQIDDATRRQRAARGRVFAEVDEYLLSLGTIEPRKDIPSLVRAFNVIAPQRPSLHLVIAGPDGWGVDAVRDVINASPYRSRIRRTGWLTDADRDDLLAGTKAFVYPSLLEGFGIPPLEAMAAGVPVVATRTGSLPEVLSTAAQWAEPGDIDTLVAAIETVLDDPEVARSLVTAGDKRLKHFSWDRSTDELVALFELACAARA